ncbi:hypothetical protein AB0K00_00965 [Dactylosporangium sp. NPDC049525]|uniref:hypothetical protein n=1 Tax=Dactylosporangium sp. NPDC049525 TaxID=3154730 RepID=UPI003413F6FB
MRRTSITTAAVVASALLSACDAATAPASTAQSAAAQSAAAPPSASAAPSPTGCTEQSAAARQMRATAVTSSRGNVHTLTIGAGNALCFPVTVSATVITYGGAAAPWSHSGYAKWSVGRYAGTSPLVFTMPRITSPCSGIAVFVGTALAANDLAQPGSAGVVTGFTVPATSSADGSSFSQVVAVDLLGGPACAAAPGAPATTASLPA